MNRPEHQSDEDYEEGDEDAHESDQRPGSHTSGGKHLTYVLAGLTALVAGGIAIVGWNFVDSVQKHTSEMNNLHVTADNAKVDTQRFDSINNQMAEHLVNNPEDPEQALQEAVFQLKGSEIPYNKALSAYDQSLWSDAAEHFTEALAKLPDEINDKKQWRAFGHFNSHKSYAASALERRALCYNHLGKPDKALVDINMALKYYPDYDQYWQDRSEIYTALGQKKLAAADAFKAQELKKKTKFHRRKPDGSER